MRWARWAVVAACGTTLACGAGPLAPVHPALAPAPEPRAEAATPPPPTPAQRELAAPRPSSPDACEIADYTSPPGSPLPDEAPITGAVRRTCAGLEARAARLLRAAMPASWRAVQREMSAEDGDEDGAETPTDALAVLRGPLGHCQRAGAGAWLLEPTRAAFAPSDDEGEIVYQVDARLVHVDASGATVHGVERALYLDALDGSRRVAEGPTPVHDFDGDGRVEVSVRFRGDDAGLELHTATATGVEFVPFPTDVRDGRWLDVDEDGRPDLLSAGPYLQAECYEPDVTWGMPELLVHSGSGLTFSQTDAVATGFARGICPCRPTQLLAPSGGVEPPLYTAQTLVRIACARLWGSSLAEIEERLDVELRPFDEDDGLGDVCAHSLETLVSFATPEPPLSLDDR